MAFQLVVSSLLKYSSFGLSGTRSRCRSAQVNQYEATALQRAEARFVSVNSIVWYLSAKSLLVRVVATLEAPLRSLV